jgi:hypothetical protein
MNDSVPVKVDALLKKIKMISAIKRLKFVQFVTSVLFFFSIFAELNKFGLFSRPKIKLMKFSIQIVTFTVPILIQRKPYYAV